MQKNKPKIKLEVDRKADVKMAVDFVKFELETGEVGFVEWFLPKSLHFVLDKNFSHKERKKIIVSYADDFYSENKKEIEAQLDKIKKDWLKVENEYFDLVNKIFKNHPWPKSYYKEGYIGMSTIFRMYPRFINKKYFFFPYRHEISDFALHTIAHEILHFIFFDYIEKRYGIKEDTEFEGKHERYVWQVSEAFNVVIEDWKPYFDIFGVPGDPYTKEQVEICKKMRKQWEKEQDIDKLLDFWFLGEKIVKK